MIRKQNSHCLTLLVKAKTDPNAEHELLQRASSWHTCAVGEMAARLSVTPWSLYYHDPCKSTDPDAARLGYNTRLEQLGMRFMRQVGDRKYGLAKRTYKTIEAHVKKVFGTKAKRIKCGLESQ